MIYFYRSNFFKKTMLKEKYMFNNYEVIVENHIASIDKTDQVFSTLVKDKINPNYEKLRLFFELIDVDINFSKIDSIRKAFISAREGKVLYLDYPSFKNVAHYVLDFIPNYWKHFRLVLKIYNHKKLTQDILSDEKIKNKLNKKKDLIEKPAHENNIYIEFLCPRFQGRLISWGNGSSDIEELDYSYSINVIRNLLKENPMLPGQISNYEDVLNIIKKYFLFTVKVDEAIPEKILFSIFSFINNVIGDKHSGVLFQYFGDFEDDILFKNNLNSIVDVFELNQFIGGIGFCDNWCNVELKFSDISKIDNLEEYSINSRKISLLQQAIKWCEKKITNGENHFFVEITFN